MPVDVAKTIKLAGKTYHFFTMEETKRDALKQARRLRENGYGARIQKVKGYFPVYSFPKTPHWWSAGYLAKLKK